MFKFLFAINIAILLVSPAHAETLEIIELPPEIPQQQAISLNWDCDVLLLTTSQRYRPTSCKRDAQDDQAVSELQVEKISLEPATPARSPRKGIY
ncbi:MAG: hypothetical protein ACSHXK_06395 [Oceanococcus sp.]